MTSQVLAVFVLVAIAAINAQVLAPQEPPQPYAFEYRNLGEDGGSSSHQSQGDGSGRVTGSYTVGDPDGRSRQVDYVADELGFRATVTSNEPGVESSAPADVQVTQVAGPAPVSASVPLIQPAVRRIVAPQPYYLRPAPQPVYRYISAPRSPYEYIYRR